MWQVVVGVTEPYLLGVEMFVQLQKVSSQGSKISILCWDVDDRDNQCQGWTVRVRYTYVS
jgi:hypothetical protein